MSIFNRMLLSMIVLATLVGCFAACGKKPEAPSTETDAPDVGGSVEEDGWSNVYDDVPNDLSFGEEDNRREFVMLIRSEEPYCTEFDVFEDSSLLLNQAIFRRNLAVENRLGVVLRMDPQVGNYPNAGKFNQMIRNSVNGNVVAWHAIAAYAGGGITSIALQNCFHNMNEIQYLDFTKSYWNQSISEQFTLDNQLYFQTGDISPQLLGQSVVFFENLAVANDFGIESVYELVESGEWTHEKLLALSKQVYRDMNGNTRVDRDDLFGLIMPLNAQVDSFYASYNLPITELDENGTLKFAFHRDRVIEVYNALYTLLCESEDNVWAKKDYVDDVGSDYLQAFINGGALFTANRLYTATNYLNKMENYAILPYPKFDTMQADYVTYSWDQYSLILVPSDIPAADLSFVGAVLEVMASNSQNIVTPAYYQLALKHRYSPNAESSRMLDYIYGHIRIEYCYIRSLGDIPSPVYFLREQIQTGRNFITASYQSNYQKFSIAFEKQFEEA